MITNRYFKTTIGVAFELVIASVAKVLADYATFTLFQAAAVKGWYMAFYNDGTRLGPKALTFGTVLTAAQKKLPITFAYCDVAGEVISTTPLIGETIRAEVVLYKAPSLLDATLTLTSGTPLLTQEFVFKVIETTPGALPLPVWDYTSVFRVSAAASYTEIVASINAAKQGEFFTAVAVAGGIQVISTDKNRHFKLAMDVIPSKAATYDDTTWSTVVNTVAFAGSGTFDQLKALELESWVKRGIGHLYPNAGTNPSDFGLPNSMADFVGGAATCDIVCLTGTRFDKSPTPNGIQNRPDYVFIAVPSGQGAAIAAVFA